CSPLSLNPGLASNTPCLLWFFSSELEFKRTDANDVAIRESDCSIDPRAADQCTVRALEVFERSASANAVDVNTRVPPGNVRIIQPNGTGGISSDDIIAVHQNKVAILTDQPAVRFCNRRRRIAS